MSVFGSLERLTWLDGLEILIFWVVIYAILRSLRGTRGLGIMKGGVGFIVGLYLFSRVLEQQFGIEFARLTFVIENLVTAALLAFVVIFQPEVRRGLTRLGERPFAWMAPRNASRSVSPIAEAAGQLSRRRIGMLVAIQRNVGFGSIIERGVPLSADVSAALLGTIFHPNTPLHDGAVIVRGDKMVAASCLLPLSDSPILGPEVGTRHRAAVGLTEETDALVIVVSEQTGRISIAYRGVLRPMRDTRDLESLMNFILEGGEPEWSERHDAEGSPHDTATHDSGVHGPARGEPEASDADDGDTVLLTVDEAGRPISAAKSPKEERPADGEGGAGEGSPRRPGGRS